MSDNGSPIEYYHKNPRQITVQQFENLERWLEELGDLSGVVHDLNSNQIIGGNQRGRVFEINECEFVLTDEYDEPDEQGTVAIGYIVWKGYRYTYRQVRWDEHQCEMGNLVANKAGGEWDYEILANKFEINDILDAGFQEEELGVNVSTAFMNEELLLDQSVQLKPPAEFVIVLCDSLQEFELLRSLLGLGLVRRGGYKAGSPFDATGTERILKASRLLEVIGDADSNAE